METKVIMFLNIISMSVHHTGVVTLQSDALVLSASLGLTSVAVVVRIHKGQAQPLVLLQSTLVCKTPINRTHHMCLLVAVIDGSFGHVDRFPKCKVKK